MSKDKKMSALSIFIGMNKKDFGIVSDIITTKVFGRLRLSNADEVPGEEEWIVRVVTDALTLRAMPGILQNTCFLPHKITDDEIDNLRSNCDSFAEFAAYLVFFRNMNVVHAINRLKEMTLTYFEKHGGEKPAKEEEDGETGKKVIGPKSIFMMTYAALVNSVDMDDDFKDRILGIKNLSDEDCRGIINAYKDSKKFISYDITHGIIQQSPFKKDLDSYGQRIRFIYSVLKTEEVDPHLRPMLMAEMNRCVIMYKISSKSSSVKLNAIGHINVIKKLLSKLSVKVQRLHELTVTTLSILAREFPAFLEIGNRVDMAIRIGMANVDHKLTPGVQVSTAKEIAERKDLGLTALKAPTTK